MSGETEPTIIKPKIFSRCSSCIPLKTKILWTINQTKLAPSFNLKELIISCNSENGQESPFRRVMSGSLSLLGEGCSYHGPLAKNKVQCPHFLRKESLQI
jgi:hypothetical protein